MRTIICLALFLQSYPITFCHSKSKNEDLGILSSKPIALLKISLSPTKIDYQYFLIGGFKCICISEIPTKQNWQSLNHFRIEEVLRLY
jgi:hypothetical protein